MRPSALLTTISLLLHTVHSNEDVQSPNEALPFFAPSPRSPRPMPLDLLKRQSTCPTGYISCSSISASEACCPSNTNCALDSANQVACCPKNYVCTGTIYGSGSGTLSPTSTETAVGGVVGGTVTVTSTAGVTATTTGITAATTAAATGITAGSTVVNNYYPFPYISTAYANSAVCASAYTFCQAQSTSCFDELVGTNGVTVSNAVGAGGTTVLAVTGVVQSSASSICSSLSLTACYGLQTSQCAAFGSTGIATANIAQRTGCAGMRYVAGAGLGIVAMGMAV